MKICNIESIIVSPSTVERLRDYYQEVDLDEYRKEAEEIFRAGGAGGEEAEELRNLLYCLINQLSVLEEGEL